MFTDWDHDQWKTFGTGVLWVVLSFICFQVLQYIGRWYLFGRCTFRTFSYFRRRANAQNTSSRDSKSLSIIPPNKKWRISNEGVSLIHSVISGFWALYSILYYPELINDLINARPQVAIDLILLSTGYLLHDLVDLLINERSVRILELLFHHVVVLTAFATTVITQKFLGVSAFCFRLTPQVVICGLLMELNSIFLHSRSLLNLYGTDKKAVSFRMVALLNIVTLLTFRLAVSFYLVYWQVTVAWGLKWSLTIVTFFVIFSLLVTNCILAYRVMAADGWFGAARSRSRAPTQPDDNDVGDEEEEEEETTGEPRPATQRLYSEDVAVQTPHGHIVEDVAVQTPNGEVNTALVNSDIPPV